MTNKHAQRCHYCHVDVMVGEGQVWKWNGRWYCRHNDCKKDDHRASPQRFAPTDDETDPIDWNDTSEEGEARAKRALLRKNADRYVSHVIELGGREYYQNKRGRCEDAPCCGCCTI